MEARLVKRDGSFYVQPSVKGFDFQIEIPHRQAGIADRGEAVVRAATQRVGCH